MYLVVFDLAANARRLLADAEVVFAHGTHQTAASLAILAMEEVGKFFQLRWDLKDRTEGKASHLPARGPKAHRAKQATVGSFYAAETAIEAMKEFLRNIGYSDENATMQTFLTALHQPDEKAKKALEKV